MMSAIILTAALTIPREALQYQAALIREVRYAWGLDGPVAAMAGQIHQESGWRSDAKSPYAVGIAQFTPGTASWLSGLQKSLGSAAPLDAGWSIRAMVAYDQLLYKGVRTADTECDRWLYALSDYNGGSGWRISRQAHSATPGDYFLTSVINPGITKANQRQNEGYPVRIVLTLQPVYASWGTKQIC